MAGRFRELLDSTFDPLRRHLETLEDSGYISSKRRKKVQACFAISGTLIVVSLLLGALTLVHILCGDPLGAALYLKGAKYCFGWAFIAMSIGFGGMSIQS
jgi:hypothetical protein